MPTTRTSTRKPATTITHNPAKPARKAPPAKTTARKAARRPAPVPGKTATKTTKPAKTPKPAKTDRNKLRLVRDSFTMPQTDHDLIGILKTRALAFQHPAKKSELLRGGLHALAALDDAAFRSRLQALVPLKPGRPKKVG